MDASEETSHLPPSCSEASHLPPSCSEASHLPPSCSEALTLDLERDHKRSFVVTEGEDAPIGCCDSVWRLKDISNSNSGTGVKSRKRHKRELAVDTEEQGEPKATSRPTGGTVAGVGCGKRKGSGGKVKAEVCDPLGGAATEGWPPRTPSCLGVDRYQDGFRWVGHLVKVVTYCGGTKRPATWRWAEGIIKSWTPKFKRFFIHFLEEDLDPSDPEQCQRLLRRSSEEEALWRVPPPRCSTLARERGWFSAVNDEIRVLSAHPVWIHPSNVTASGCNAISEKNGSVRTWLEFWKRTCEDNLSSNCPLCQEAVLFGNTMKMPENSENSAAEVEVSTVKVETAADTPFKSAAVETKKSGCKNLVDSPVLTCDACAVSYHTDCLLPHQRLRQSFPSESDLCIEASVHRRHCRDASKVRAALTGTRASGRVGAGAQHSGGRDGLRAEASHTQSTQQVNGATGREATLLSKRRSLRGRCLKATEILPQTEHNAETGVSSTDEEEEEREGSDDSMCDRNINFADQVSEVAVKSNGGLPEAIQLLLRKVSREHIRIVQRKIRETRGRVGNGVLQRAVAEIRCVPPVDVPAVLSEGSRFVKMDCSRKDDSEGLCSETATPEEQRYLANFIRAYERHYRWNAPDLDQLVTSGRFSMISEESKRFKKEEENLVAMKTYQYKVACENAIVGPAISSVTSSAGQLLNVMKEEETISFSEVAGSQSDTCGAVAATEKQPPSSISETETPKENESLKGEQEESIWLCPGCNVCRFCWTRLSDVPSGASSKRALPPLLDLSGHPLPLSDAVVCHGCGMAAHGACCFPPVPILHTYARWRCDRCSICHSCGHKDLQWPNYAAWDLTFQHCASCFKALQLGQYCGVCRKSWDADNFNGGAVGGSDTPDSNFWTLCDSCHLWIHGTCDSQALKGRLEARQCQQQRQPFDSSLVITSGASSGRSPRRQDNLAATGTAAAADFAKIETSSGHQRTESAASLDSDMLPVEPLKVLQDSQQPCLSEREKSLANVAPEEVKEGGASNSSPFSGSSNSPSSGGPELSAEGSAPGDIAVNSSCSAVSAVSSGSTCYRCPTCRSSDRQARYLRLLERLMVLDKKKEFSYPVPRTFVSYWRVVKNPMHLSEIQARVYRGLYTSDRALLVDFSIMIHNAKLVHMPNTRIYRSACSLEKKGLALAQMILELPKWNEMELSSLRTEAAELTASLKSATAQPLIISEMHQCLDVERHAALYGQKTGVVEECSENSRMCPLQVESVDGDILQNTSSGGSNVARELARTKVYRACVSEELQRSSNHKAGGVQKWLHASLDEGVASGFRTPHPLRELENWSASISRYRVAVVTDESDGGTKLQLTLPFAFLFPKQSYLDGVVWRRADGAEKETTGRASFGTLKEFNGRAKLEKGFLASLEDEECCFFCGGFFYADATTLEVPMVDALRSIATRKWTCQRCCRSCHASCCGMSLFSEARVREKGNASRSFFCQDCQSCSLCKGSLADSVSRGSRSVGRRQLSALLQQESGDVVCRETQLSCGADSEKRETASTSSVEKECSFWESALCRCCGCAKGVHVRCLWGVEPVPKNEVEKSNCMEEAVFEMKTKPIPDNFPFKRRVPFPVGGLSRRPMEDGSRIDVKAEMKIPLRNGIQAQGTNPSGVVFVNTVMTAPDSTIPAIKTEDASLTSRGLETAVASISITATPERFERSIPVSTIHPSSPARASVPLRNIGFVPNETSEPKHVTWETNTIQRFAAEKGSSAIKSGTMGLAASSARPLFFLPDSLRRVPEVQDPAASHERRSVLCCNGIMEERKEPRTEQGSCNIQCDLEQSCRPSNCYTAWRSDGVGGDAVDGDVVDPATPSLASTFSQPDSNASRHCNNGRSEPAYFQEPGSDIGVSSSASLQQTMTDSCKTHLGQASDGSMSVPLEVLAPQTRPYTFSREIQHGAVAPVGAVPQQASDATRLSPFRNKGQLVARQGILAGSQPENVLPLAACTLSTAPRSRRKRTEKTESSDSRKSSLASKKHNQQSSYGLSAGCEVTIPPKRNGKTTVTAMSSSDQGVVVPVQRASSLFPALPTVALGWSLGGIGVCRNSYTDLAKQLREQLRTTIPGITWVEERRRLRFMNEAVLKNVFNESLAAKVAASGAYCDTCCVEFSADSVEGSSHHSRHAPVLDTVIAALLPPLPVLGRQRWRTLYSPSREAIASTTELETLRMRRKGPVLVCSRCLASVYAWDYEDLRDITASMASIPVLCHACRAFQRHGTREDPEIREPSLTNPDSLLEAALQLCHDIKLRLHCVEDVSFVLGEIARSCPPHKVGLKGVSKDPFADCPQTCTTGVFKAFLSSTSAAGYLTGVVLPPTGLNGVIPLETLQHLVQDKSLDINAWWQMRTQNWEERRYCFAQDTAHLPKHPSWRVEPTATTSSTTTSSATIGPLSSPRGDVAASAITLLDQQKHAVRLYVDWEIAQEQRRAAKSAEGERKESFFSLTPTLIQKEAELLLQILKAFLGWKGEDRENKDHFSSIEKGRLSHSTGHTVQSVRDVGNRTGQANLQKSNVVVTRLEPEHDGCEAQRCETLLYRWLSSSENPDGPHCGLCGYAQSPILGQYLVIPLPFNKESASPKASISVLADGFSTRVPCVYVHKECLLWSVHKNAWSASHMQQKDIINGQLQQLLSEICGPPQAPATFCSATVLSLVEASASWLCDTCEKPGASLVCNNCTKSPSAEKRVRKIHLPCLLKRALGIPVNQYGRVGAQEQGGHWAINWKRLRPICGNCEVLEPPSYSSSLRPTVGWKHVMLLLASVALRPVHIKFSSPDVIGSGDIMRHTAHVEAPNQAFEDDWDRERHRELLQVVNHDSTDLSRIDDLHHHDLKVQSNSGPLFHASVFSLLAVGSGLRYFLTNNDQRRALEASPHLIGFQSVRYFWDVQFAGCRVKENHAGVRPHPTVDETARRTYYLCKIVGTPSDAFVDGSKTGSGVYKEVDALETNGHPIMVERVSAVLDKDHVGESGCFSEGDDGIFGRQMQDGFEKGERGHQENKGVPEKKVSSPDFIRYQIWRYHNSTENLQQASTKDGVTMPWCLVSEAKSVESCVAYLYEMFKNPEVKRGKKDQVVESEVKGSEVEQQRSAEDTVTSPLEPQCVMDYRSSRLTTSEWMMSAEDFFGLTHPTVVDWKRREKEVVQAQILLGLPNCSVSVSSQFLADLQLNLQSLHRTHRARLWLYGVPPRQRPVWRELGSVSETLVGVSTTSQFPAPQIWQSTAAARGIYVFSGVESSSTDFPVTFHSRRGASAIGGRSASEVRLQGSGNRGGPWNSAAGFVPSHRFDTTSPSPFMGTEWKTQQAKFETAGLGGAGGGWRSPAFSGELTRARQRFDRMPPAMQYRYLLMMAQDQRVQAELSPIHGMGLFATCRIPKGEPVVEYVGHVVRNVIADKREKFYERLGSRDAACYMFRLDKHYVVDATTAGNVARFINHSCDPNCVCRVIAAENGRNHIVIFAARDLEPGEEVTYDYKFNIEEESLRIVCQCGAATCLGRMN